MDSVFFAFIAYDNWHIANGVHQPSVAYWREFRFEDIVDAILRMFGKYLKDINGTPITKEYLQDLWSKRKTEVLSLEIKKNNQEGWLIIQESYTEDCYCD